jgi:outer membrane biosynthesis protein TonB
VFVGPHALVIPTERGWALDTRGGLEGHARIGDSSRPLLEWKGRLLPLDAGVRCRVRVGELTALVRRVTLPERPGGSAFVEGRELAFTGLSLAAHVGLLILFVVMPPDDEIQIRRHGRPIAVRIISVESIANREKEEEPEVVDDEPSFDELEPKFEAPVRLVAREPAPAPERRVDVSRPDRPHPVRMRPRPRRDPGLARRISRAMVPQQLLDSITKPSLLPGAATGPRIRVIGTAGTADTDIDRRTALASPARDGGWAGLDMDGTRPRPEATPGSGPKTTTEPRRKTRCEGPLCGVKITEKTQKRAIVDTVGETSGGGGLTKAIVGKYISRQKGAVIACYRKVVQRDPTLAGTVSVRFTITPTGSVRGPRLVRSTLKSQEVHSC